MERIYTHCTETGRKEWAVIGKLGALSFWVSAYGAVAYGGIEKHYYPESKPKSALGYAKHEKCNFTGGACWHDGSSLWAREYWIPQVLPLGDVAIWERLEANYAMHMEDK